jgi:tetratricopeptide (TPR) repeat protein
VVTSPPIVRRHVILIALALAALTAAAYWPIRQHPFVNFDDPQYVVENPRVTEGLTWPGVQWAFTTGHAGNWHPLSWLSHMADVELFGVNPGAHHLVSLVLHIVSALLLFGVLLRMTGATGASAFVAAVFALHPLHVESVAWIAERKDVLSGLFFMLTLWTYVSYVQRPSAIRYAVVLVCFALGLMAKPMLVTVPLVLLLIDLWPLARMEGPVFRPAVLRSLVVDKLPLFAIAIASSIVTFVVQQQAGAVRTFEVLPITTRLANAVVAYVTYLWQAIWPAGLAPIYPYPASLSPVVVIAAATALAAITWMAWRWRHERPYVLVGWLWYVVMLVPVIGLVQVGSQPVADRYTYLPLIGVTIAVAWGARELLTRVSRGPAIAGVTIAAIAIVLAIATRWQVEHWRTSITLWQHATHAVPGNYRAHINLGHALEIAGRRDEAIGQTREAVRIKPGDAEARNNLGRQLLESGQTAEALAESREAVRLSPRGVSAHNNLGLALAAAGQTEESIVHFTEATRLAPLFAPAHSNLGVALARLGRLDQAIAVLQESLRLQPGQTQAQLNLARALTDRGRRRFEEGELNGALGDADAAIAVQSGFAEAHHERGRALLALGREEEAVRALIDAARLAPTVADFHYDAAIVLARLKRIPDALRMLEAALLVDPNHAEARAAAQALLKAGR